jgi:hypothetical protein
MQAQSHEQNYMPKHTQKKRKYHVVLRASIVTTGRGRYDHIRVPESVGQTKI